MDGLLGRFKETEEGIEFISGKFRELRLSAERLLFEDMTEGVCDKVPGAGRRTSDMPC